jgi:thiosulfate/3-mercaptopyruvate sulfurtransferase
MAVAASERAVVFLHVQDFRGRIFCFVYDSSSIDCRSRHAPTSNHMNLKRVVLVGVAALAPLAFADQASLIPNSELISPDELVKILQASKSEKPLMIQVGSHVLYSQAHIPGSEYIGPASSESGLTQLRKRVEGLPRNTLVLIYCGCCPWSHCPNVKPADDALHAMGFTRVKVLYIGNNFGTDWVDKGYPVAKGD